MARDRDVFAITFCRSPAGAPVTSIEGRIREKRKAKPGRYSIVGFRKKLSTSSGNAVLARQTPNSRRRRALPA